MSQSFLTAFGCSFGVTAGIGLGVALTGSAILALGQMMGLLDKGGNR